MQFSSNCRGLFFVFFSVLFISCYSFLPHDKRSNVILFELSMALGARTIHICIGRRECTHVSCFYGAVEELYSRGSSMKHES